MAAPPFIFFPCLTQITEQFRYNSLLLRYNPSPQRTNLKLQTSNLQILTFAAFKETLVINDQKSSLGDTGA
jgi:hypothetical protein